jgi:hypothetical protein
LAVGTAYAQETPTPEEETCESCHSAEAETWQVSPHAELDDAGAPLASCESCHGEYQRGHPETDNMTLDIDSSVCNDCHEETAAEWHATTHAQANVQCIGCHKVHSQTLRLTEDKLCVACHKDPVQDEFHTAHWVGAVSCIECHMATPGTTDVPVHDFVHVAAQQCLDCHKEEIVAGPMPTATRLALAAPEQAENTRQLAVALDTATENNRFLLLLGPVLLGVGVGIGGILGIVFMLVTAYLEGRKREPQEAPRQDVEEGS